METVMTAINGLLVWEKSMMLDRTTQLEGPLADFAKDVI